MEQLLDLLPAIIFVVLLDVSLIVLILLHHRERREMLDRLMAKSFPEYKDHTQPEENQLENDEDDGTVPLEEAEEEYVDALGEEDDGEKK